MKRESGSDSYESPGVAIILGMHRSGTSVLAGALSSLGYDLGDKLIRGDLYNEKGYFENLDVVNINDSILESLGCSWHSLVIPDQLHNLDGQFSEKAVAILNRHIDDTKPWGFKDPRVTRLLPFWQDILKQNQTEPRYLVANRHPLSIADSLSKRDNFPLAHSLALWLVHQYDALQTMTAHKVMFVDYDLMLSDPSAQFKRISVFLGVDSDRSKVQEFRDKFLDKSLCHSEYAAADLDGCCDDLGEICKVLYEYIHGLAKLDGDVCLDDVHAGELVSRQVATYMKNKECWFTAIDQASRNLNQASLGKIVALQSKIKRLESQLGWLDSNPIIQLLRSLKVTTRRLLGNSQNKKQK